MWKTKQNKNSGLQGQLASKLERLGALISDGHMVFIA